MYTPFSTQPHTLPLISILHHVCPDPYSYGFDRKLATTYFNWDSAFSSEFYDRVRPATMPGIKSSEFSIVIGVVTVTATS
jgi:hypothetical protein